jgi:hypothetical protein
MDVLVGIDGFAMKALSRDQHGVNQAKVYPQE